MGLSPQVPSVLARHVGGVVRDRLLAPHGLTPADVTGWAVHPGGRRILEVVEEQLELPPRRWQRPTRSSISTAIARPRRC